MARFQKDASEDRRCKLGHRCKRDQADRHQGVVFTDEMKIGIAEHHHQNVAAAADGQQDVAQVGALSHPQRGQPQQNRHDQVIADHGRQRNGRNDDHAGCGRHAADENEQCQALIVIRHWQRQDERVGIHAAGTELQHAAERYRQDEDVDRQQVERKKPYGLVQMVFVDVFHHHDLKLARQEHDGHHGQKNMNAPVGIRPGPDIEGE